MEKFGPDYLGFIKTGKKNDLVQDAHEAIRPTGTHRTPDLVARYVEPDEAKLYRLIYDRALASLMSDKLEEQTTALFGANGLVFKATGTRTLFKGYEAIYGDFEDDDTKLLPEIKEGEKYAINKVDPEQKFTKAPARYSEAKVVKMMEEKGIGRPSTYASTIKTLIDRGYVTSKSGIITPTETGLRTTLVLNKYFPEIVSTEYTADMIAYTKDQGEEATMKDAIRAADIANEQRKAALRQQRKEREERYAKIQAERQARYASQSGTPSANVAPAPLPDDGKADDDAKDEGDSK